DNNLFFERPVGNQMPAFVQNQPGGSPQQHFPDSPRCRGSLGPRPRRLGRETREHTAFPPGRRPPPSPFFSDSLLARRPRKSRRPDSAKSTILKYTGRLNPSVPS